MSTTLYRIGQRVLVKNLGLGQVIGFEVFDKNGNEAPRVSIDPGERARVIVKLDTPWRWRTAATPDPYVFRHNVAPAE